MGTTFLVSYGGLWVLVVAQTLVVIGLLRAVFHLQSMTSSVTGAPLGELAPDFSTVDLEGRPVAASDFAGVARVFLFVRPNCESCVLTLSDMAALRSKAEGNVIVVCQGESGPCRELISRYEISEPVLLDPRNELTAMFKVIASPTAVLVDETDRIARYGTPQQVEESTESDDVLAGASLAAPA